MYLFFKLKSQIKNPKLKFHYWFKSFKTIKCVFSTIYFVACLITSIYKGQKVTQSNTKSFFRENVHMKRPTQK